MTAARLRSGDPMSPRHGRRAAAILAITAAGILSAAVAIADVVDLPVRFGSHQTYDRIVFDWREPVEYRVNQTPGAATLHFDRAARIDQAALTAGLAKLAASAELASATDELVIRINMPEHSQLRHFRAGTKVVLDLTRKSAAPAPDRTAPAPVPTPIAAAASSAPAETGSSAASARTDRLPRKPIPLRGSLGDTPAAATQLHAPPSAPAQASPARESPPPAVTRPAKVPVEIVRTPDGLGLRFVWNEPVGAAVFGRGAHLWIVFDREAILDLPRLRDQNDDTLGPLEVIAPEAGSRATALRLSPAAGTGSAARREGNAWVIDIGRLPRAPDSPIFATTRVADDPSAARLVAELPGARAAVPFRDPEIGDEIIVAPSAAAGIGMERARAYPQFRVLASVQGLAIERRADALSVRALGNSVEVSAGTGLYLSDTRYTPDSRAAGRYGGRGPVLFDFGVWRRNGPDHFNEDRRELHRAAAEASEANRNAARLELARFLFTYGHFEDALGVLRLIEQDEPELTRTAQVRAIRGVSALMGGDLELAQRELGHASLDGNPEAALWRGALAMALGDARTARIQIGRSGELYRNHPERFGNRLNLWSAEARMLTNDAAGAEAHIESVLANRPTASERAQAIYLRGRMLLAKGDREAAAAAWEELDRAPPTPGRTAATLERIEILLQEKKIAPAEGLAMLDRLRFSWRGDELEFRTLARLGRVQIAAGEYRTGLLTLRNALTIFPNHREAKAITAAMSEAFIALFADDKGAKLSPVAAIALFEEFRGLIPSGPQGDEMALRLADRLIAVDLLDRAGALLEAQVNSRLSGEKKSHAGAKLALVRLLDRKPQAALDALAASAVPDLTPDLRRERGRLEARALADLGRTTEALQRLAGDDAPETDVLRADIAWQAQDWAAAAEALDRLVATPAADTPIADDQARQVIHLAVALTLAGDKEGVRRLNGRLGAAMRRTPHKDVYSVIVAQTDGPVGDVREVAQRVSAAAPFQSFLAGYRQRLLAAAPPKPGG